MFEDKVISKILDKIHMSDMLFLLIIAVKNVQFGFCFHS